MRTIKLVGTAPVASPPPSEQVLRTLKEFGDGYYKLKNFQENVARASAQVARDPRDTGKIAIRLFDELNEQIKLHLIMIDRTDWRDALQIPRPLARYSAEPPIKEFIRHGFGRPAHQDNELEKIGPTGSERRPQDLLYSAFWAEIRTTNESELPPTVDQALEAMWRSTLRWKNSVDFPEWLEKIQKKAVPNFTYLFITDQNLPVQVVVSIPYGKLASFISDVEKGKWESPHGVMLESISLADLIEFRRQPNAEQVEYASDIFADEWDKAAFYKELNLEKGSRPDDSIVENAIFRDILSQVLKDKSTVQPKPDRNSQEGSANSLPIDLVAKLQVLDDFARENPGAVVSDKVLQVFPDLISRSVEAPAALPTVAPLKWPQDRATVDSQAENPYQFIMRVYEPWLGKGLTRGDIRRLDEPLAQALYHYIRKNGMPTDLNLPSKVELNSEWVQRIEQGEAVSEKGVPIDSETIREARRLDALRRRRQAKTETGI